MAAAAAALASRAERPGSRGGPVGRRACRRPAGVALTNTGTAAADGNYLDWSIGASYSAGPATLSIAYIDTDIKKTGVKADDTLYDPTVVFTLGVAF